MMKEKKTPLHFACEKGDTEVAILLIEKEANIDAVDEVISF